MNKILIIILLLLIYTVLFSSPNAEIRGKRSNKGEVAIFSAVKGNISLNSVPLERVKLTRTYPEIGKVSEITEIVYTDKNGDFKFEEVKGNLGIMRFLPHEAVIHQTIEAEYLSKKYLIWYTCKRNYNTLGELKYYKMEPILNPEMLVAYKEGYILLNCNLENSEDFIQSVNSNISIISISDFRFPYELALKTYTQLLVDKEGKFTSEIGKWFDNNPRFFDQLTNDDEGLSDMEREDLTPYFGVVIQSVNSVKYSDYLKLEYFEEDYDKDVKRVTVNGEIILNVLGTKGENLMARVWLRSALFKVSKDNIILEPQDYYFMINSANIDPNIID